MLRLLLSLALLLFAMTWNVAYASNGQTGRCANVRCLKGRMCIENDDDTMSCVCPQACLNESDPVCSAYLVEYKNLCVLHKFACHNEILVGVSNKGPCDVNALRRTSKKNVSECAAHDMLQFADRYLEWILINRKRLVDRFASIEDDERGRKLSPASRTDLAQWEFNRLDIDRDGALYSQEIDGLINPLLFHEKCIYGFVMSCTLSTRPIITREDWLSCFPTKEIQQKPTGLYP